MLNTLAIGVEGLDAMKEFYRSSIKDGEILIPETILSGIHITLRPKETRTMASPQRNSRIFQEEQKWMSDEIAFDIVSFGTDLAISAVFQNDSVIASRALRETAKLLNGACFPKLRHHEPCACFYIGILVARGVLFGIEGADSLRYGVYCHLKNQGVSPDEIFRAFGPPAPPDVLQKERQKVLGYVIERLLEKKSI